MNTVLTPVEWALLQEVVNTAADLEGFLQEFPGETVLMRLQDATDMHTSTISFEQAFKNYQARYPGLFWNNGSKEANPTLGEIRGKIVILQDFTATGSYGLPYSSFNSQDDYNFSTNWYLYTKWTEVTNQLGTASLPDQMCPLPSLCAPYCRATIDGCTSIT